MSIVLADGPPSIEVKGDLVCVTFTSGGDVFCSAFKLADANQGIADYFAAIEEREGREANVLAYRARG